MDNQAIESIKLIIVIRIVVITGNELVMSTKSAKTSINKCILPKQHLYNNLYPRETKILVYCSIILFDILWK